MEAVDHYNAVLWIRELAEKQKPVDEMDVREIHRRIVLRSQPEIGGVYSSLPRRIVGSAVILPGPAKLPQLMKSFGEWLGLAEPGLLPAFNAHFQLVAIHPFGDGTGRTARLLMNLLLIRSGNPPVAVRPEDRKRYLDVLEHASLHDDTQPFHEFLCHRLEATLDEYLELLSGH